MTGRPLEGRAALITGANQGFGLAIAHAFVEAGAGVYLCARDGVKLEEARAGLARLAWPNQQVLAQPADVSREADVTSIVNAAVSALPSLQILVNNAGVYGPLGPIDRVDWADWVRAVEINLFGSVLMCRALVPHFRRRGGGKIIQVSGGGATNPLPNISAYAASKAAVVRFAETLAEELCPDHINVNAVAPGPLNTRLLDEVLTAGPDAVGREFYDRSVKQKRDGGAPMTKGAELCVFLASSASDGITGKLISALWDPWSELPKYRADLETSDIYTLRRVVAKDRGKTWEQ